jgi:hypothetical protein
MKLPAVPSTTAEDSYGLLCTKSLPEEIWIKSSVEGPIKPVTSDVTRRANKAVKKARQRAAKYGPKSPPDGSQIKPSVAEAAPKSSIEETTLQSSTAEATPQSPIAEASLQSSTAEAALQSSAAETALKTSEEAALRTSEEAALRTETETARSWPARSATPSTRIPASLRTPRPTLM